MDSISGRLNCKGAVTSPGMRSNHTGHQVSDAYDKCQTLLPVGNCEKWLKKAMSKNTSMILYLVISKVG